MKLKTNLSPHQRAALIAEALPYIQRFTGESMVIKYGGSAMIDEEIKQSLIHDLILLRLVGVKPHLVHGGGKEITSISKKMGKKSIFIEGLRVTDSETLEITQMVLIGKINLDLVSRINAAGGRAVGLSGKDGNFIHATQKKPMQSKGKKKIDLGYVGEVKEINPEILHTLNEKEYIPVIAPTGLGPQGHSLNLNADTAAAHIAAALPARKLIFLTDQKGVLRDPKDPDSLIQRLTLKETEKMLKAGKFKDGMNPKMAGAIFALKNGVQKIHIIDGRLKHALLLELFTDEGIGTLIQK